MTVPTMSLSMLGQKYSFRSKNANDTVLYSGTISRFVTAEDAGEFGNIISYNQAVRQVDATVPSDVTQLSCFFVIKLDNTTGTQKEYVMAPEWIMDGSFSVLDTSAVVMVKVLDSATSDHKGIIEALMGAGYLNSSIVSVD